ncbi:MAG: hypothetical protein MUF85_00280 [Patescibacteria group bacterium]|nr:hypothetical protein [Patescibacteria group bacterium]
MIWLYLSYGLVTLGFIKLTMMLLMQVSGDINDLNTARRIKKSLNSKRPYRPKVSAVMLDKNVIFDIDLYIKSAKESSIKLVEFIVMVSKNDDNTYNKLKYYRKKNYLNGYLKLVRYSNESSISKIVKKSTKSSFVAVFDGHAVLTNKTIEKSLPLFKDKKIKIILPIGVPLVNNAIISGIIALIRVVKLNYFRAQPLSNEELNGILLIRKTYIEKLDNTNFLKIKTNKRLLDTNNKLPAVRNTQVTVSLLDREEFTISMTIILHWLLDASIIAAIFYIRGIYQGWVALGFVFILLMLFISIAVSSYKGLKIIDRINLVLIAPITYIYIWYRIITIPFIGGYNSLNNRISKPKVDGIVAIQRN